MLPTGVLLFFVVSCTATVRLPSYMRACSRNDPNLNECALKNGRAIIPKLIPGDPSIRLPPLDPLVLDKVEISPTGASGSVTMRLRCYRCHVYGLKNARLQDVKLNLNKRQINIKLNIPRLVVTGKYDVSGRILVLPISGRGISNITLTNVNVVAGLDWKSLKRKGEEYSQFVKHRVTFTASLLRINLSNLFGDRLLSDNMNLILNENWREVLRDLAPSISDTVGHIIRVTLNQIFDLIPYSQFFPDT
ncbi:protein takeout-like [Cimex lectularius]|uniref:Uncharacterized protein n=1 Tax=Cimex lectularius TaxID=79782 RepID=A0A8I6RYX3_CIMLE|nr:protein takeout-like [Cimex lectularius]